MKKNEIKETWKKINDKTKIINLNELNSKNEFESKTIIEKNNKNKSLIDISHLSKTYNVFSFKKFKKNKKEIFNDVNFNIYENEFTALIGKNGCGKTTIVNIISNFVNQSSGDIKYNYSTDKKNNDINVQFQDLNFPRCLTVNDLFNFEMKLAKNKFNDEFLDDMLSVFQIKEILNIKFAKLSGGQQQRLNVLFSLINKPKILFLDEFSNGIDIATKNKIKKFIMDYCKKNKITVVLISHDTDIINTMASWFVVISNKKVVVNASREEILKHYNSINDFIEDYVK